MLKPFTLSKLIVIGLMLGLFLHFGSQVEVSWATGDGETQRQTVPTRTFTPRPVTPTSPPPTHTPQLPTDTPVPSAKETATPSLSPTAPLVSPAPSLTAEATPSNPAVLPTAGSGPWAWIAGALLIVGGMVALLAGLETRTSRR